MSDETERTRVHFVGVGAMGSAMVQHLADPLIDLRITDSDHDRAVQVAEPLGATAVAPGDLGSTDADVVILMLPDTAAVASVLEGDSGLLNALSPGALIADMGSSAPRATRVHAELAADHGISFIDAPVSGGVPRAVTGDLSIMIGGTADQVERLRPLVSRLGNNLQHVGDVGSGHALKALNNLLSAIGLLGASEVLAIGREFGLDPQLMLDVLNQSTGGNHATRVKMERYALSERFDSAFGMSLMVKDLRTAIELADSLGIDSQLGRHCLAEWEDADHKLGPGADHTHIWKFVETYRSESNNLVNQDEPRHTTP